MVKGVSRQVIVVKSPDPKLFEQAIFILTEEAQATGITDEMLIKEAQRAARGGRRPRVFAYGPVWACGGAVLTGLVWLLSAFI